MPVRGTPSGYPFTPGTPDGAGGAEAGWPCPDGVGTSGGKEEVSHGDNQNRKNNLPERKTRQR